LLPLVDTHCHLNFKSFAEDLDAVIARARAQGIQRIVIPAVDIPSAESAIALAKAHPGFIYAAAGIHPNDGAGWDASSLDRLRELAGASEVVAIGEIGLDFYRDYSPPGEQITIFERQLSLAVEMSLPVIVHCRSALPQLAPILADWAAGLRRTASPLSSCPGIMHAFEGSLEEAREFTSLNFMIGIGGPVTFKNALEKQAVAAGLPLASLVTETDAPFLTPHPFRGRRNEPGNIIYILEKIAQLHDQPLPVVATTLYENAAQVFKRII